MEIKNNVDRQYFELIKFILKDGVHKRDRTGTGTISVFDYSMKFNMDEGFPLLTSKKMFMKGIVHEIIWFLSGSTNIKYLVDNDVHIWDGDCYKKYSTSQCAIKWLFNKAGKEPCENDDFYRHYTKDEFIAKIKTDDEFAKEWGDLGPVYGSQWRKWNNPELYPENENSDGSECGSYSESHIDQIQNLINDLKNNPDSRRLMVTAWNPADVPNSVLPPCHYLFQCYTQEMSLEERSSRWCKSLDKHISYGGEMTHESLDSLGFAKRKLSLKWNQRSTDVGLGLSFNIASYALLLHLLSREVNMIPYELIFSGGDVHIYQNHVDGLREQLTHNTYKLPRLKLNNTSIYNFGYDDFEMIGYESSPTIKLILSN